jgi:hypothetical protein
MRTSSIVSTAFLLLLAGLVKAQDGFTLDCPAGHTDVMKYFVMDQARRTNKFMKGTSNSIYSEVLPDRDFAARGYWLWLKSTTAHGFDVKVFDEGHVYMRATELTWTDNTSFKRFVKDLPISERCVPEGKAGPEIKVEDTRYDYYSSCKPYKSSKLGTAVNDLDGPALMDVGGNVGQAWTRVLHYRYNCDEQFRNCSDEEQFYLANGFGLWQWKHYRHAALIKSTLMNEIEAGSATGKLPCEDSYR